MCFNCVTRECKIIVCLNFCQWIPPPAPLKEQQADEQITIDLGDEYEQALTDATQEEIIDLAGKDKLGYLQLDQVTSLLFLFMRSDELSPC